MHSGLLRFLARRLARAVVLVFAVSSAALLLVHLAPGDPFSAFGVDPSVADVERRRFGLDRPFVEQYAEWIGNSLRLDFGESIRFRRPVSSLLADRMWKTVTLGVAALALALAIGIPAGIRSGSVPRHWTSRAISGTALLFVSVPPLVTSLVLLLLASRVGWLPAAGSFDGPAGASGWLAAWMSLRNVPLPALALALPVAASLERLQSRAMRDALREPSILAARARGVSMRRSTWVHAWRLSLRPVLGVLGVVIGTVLSGSFVVEVVMSWPGLGHLMYEALVGRDIYLAGGCAAAGAVCLAIGLLLADVALLAADPRHEAST